jgi:hypothetical protein
MSWEPELTLSETGRRCRLVLGGDGDSLQEAAAAEGQDVRGLVFGTERRAA